MKKALSSLDENKKRKRLTVENLVLGEDDDYMEDDYSDRFEAPGNAEHPISSEPVVSDNTADIKGIIKNIRLQVLNGLAKIAEHPETEEYDTLKRILIICDKPAEQEKKEKAGKN